MSRPAVTVLMAVYNNGPYLQESIDSVLAQTLSNFELVIVDDASNDDGWSIIEAAAARDPRIIARRRPANGGASRALNDALAGCRGAYITRQDGDDVSLPERLAGQVAFLEREPGAAAVGTQALLIDETGTRLSETRFATSDDQIQATLIESMCFVGPTVMARRTAFERAGLWFDADLSGTEDYDLCLRLAEVGTLANLTSALYLYRQHGASVSHRQRHQQLSRKAQAVERAVRRRYGADAPPQAWTDVARDYVRAAVVAHASREIEASREWAEKARSFSPGIFEADGLVEDVVRRYLPSLPPSQRVRFVETLLDETFPETREMTALRARLVPELRSSALVAGQPAGAASPRIGFGGSAAAIAAALSLCGVLAVLLATSWGIGTSVDSVAYLQGARALAAGTGGPALVQHAPLYSLLLAGGAVLGVDPMDGARWLNALTLGVNITLVGLLIRRSVTHASWLWAVGSTLMLVLSPMLVVHVTALSEPVFLTCLLVGFWLLSRYLDAPTSWRLVGAAAVMALSLLARYAGAAAVLTGIIGILAMTPRPWRHRVWASAVFTTVAVLPMAAWMLRNMMVASTVTGRELAFHPVGRSHVWQALYTVSGWLLIPPSAPNALRFAVWLGLAALATVAIIRVVRAAPPIPSLVRLLALFIVTYGAFLIASISFLDANTPLDDRILLPVLAVSLILGAYLLDSLWPLLGRRPVLAGAVLTAIVLLAGGHGLKAAAVAARGYEQGWGFTSAAWRQSPALARVAGLDPGLPVYSNAPEIVYLHARRAALGLPRTRFLMNQQPNQAYATEMNAIADAVRASCGVVVYLRNLSQQAMPSETEAGQRLSLDVLSDTADGVIWGVRTCQP